MAQSPTTILRPRGLHVERTGDNRAKVVVEPLERGFGHTLGNALRRVLLSSIPGAAITEVEIDGVLHEYTTLEGLQEDVIEVLLNFKDVAIRLHNLDETTLTLCKKGKGVVTAGDIKVDHNVEIVNPEHVICHLTKDIALNMRLKIARGVGYQPATSRRRPDEEVASDRPSAARCLVLPGAPRGLRSGQRTRRTAHRPRQARFSTSRPTARSMPRKRCARRPKSCRTS